MAITPSRRTPLNGAIATAALPIITLTSLGAVAGPAQADTSSGTKPSLKPAATPTHASIAHAKATTTNLVEAAKPKTKSVTVRQGDTVWGLAQRHGVSAQKLLKLNELKASSLIFPGQKLVISKNASLPKPTAKVASTQTTKPTSSSTYKVKSGDTLTAIADRHGVSLSTLYKANNLSSSTVIYPGQKLKLRGTTSTAKTVSATAPAKKTASTGTYTVKSGDTLSAIAHKNDMSLSDLYTANNMSESTAIYPGQKLKTKGGSAATKTSTNKDNSLVSNEFLHYTYDNETHSNANTSARTLNARQVPSAQQMRQIISSTASQYGVDPQLALAHAQVESGFNARAVSPANAVGVMQVLPSTASWLGQQQGRELDPLDPYDNATAGVLYIKYLQNNAKNRSQGIAAYYQGLGGVQENGMYSDTKDYVKNVESAM